MEGVDIIQEALLTCDEELSNSDDEECSDEWSYDDMLSSEDERSDLIPDAQ